MRYFCMTIKGQRRQECIFYVVLWAILFVAPLLSMYIEHLTTHADNDWASAFSSWKLLACFLVIFLLHNFLLAPLLVYGNKRKTYFTCLAAILLSFSFYQCQMRPHPVPPHLKQEQKAPPMKPEDKPVPPEKKPHKRNDAPPPRPFGGEDMVQILVVAMLLGLNVGIKAYFKSLSERQRLKEMEHQTLQERLEYLKYQINPHFFMNTLNNIHALVEFDPQKAQEAIEILSGLMRYVLYEANKPLAPLEKEIDFVRNYIDIMRIRYVDVVSIEAALPEQVPNVMVPPLVFTTFLENAFKHGVSYEQESFVELSISVEEPWVDFHCRNSRNARAKQKKTEGGVGLKNTRKRLHLLYGSDYTLAIKQTDRDYDVHLRLPVKYN